MRLTGRGIDEYTLAAYLAGRLAPSRRREVADFLARNEDARDVLYAASQLLENEGDGQDTPPPLTAVSLPPRRKPRFNLSGSNRLSLMLWTSVALVCATAFVTTVLIAFRVGVDAGASSLAAPGQEASQQVAVTGNFSGLSWQESPGAEMYRVIVWDDALADVVGEVRSEVAFVSRESLQGFLAPQTRRVWVDAYDSGGRLLQRTRSVALRQ